MQVDETRKGCEIDSACHEWLRNAVLKKLFLFVCLDFTLQNICPTYAIPPKSL